LATQRDGPSGAIRGDWPGPAIIARDVGDQMPVTVVGDQVAGPKFVRMDCCHRPFLSSMSPHWRLIVTFAHGEVLEMVSDQVTR
jgi:hypothetical protein